jgi:hypothetical protein
MSLVLKPLFEKAAHFTKALVTDPKGLLYQLYNTGAFGRALHFCVCFWLSSIVAKHSRLI